MSVGPNRMYKPINVSIEGVLMDITENSAMQAGQAPPLFTGCRQSLVLIMGSAGEYRVPIPSPAQDLVDLKYQNIKYTIRADPPKAPDERMCGPNNYILSTRLHGQSSLNGSDVTVIGTCFLDADLGTVLELMFEHPADKLKSRELVDVEFTRNCPS